MVFLDSSNNSMNTARRDLAGAGIQTAALAFGGNTGTETAVTEEYDGTSWTSSPASLSTARQGLGGAGTQPAALGFGGYVTGVLKCNRRIYNNRNSRYKNNNGKLIWQNI
jgi:hypothetical protein